MAFFSRYQFNHKKNRSVPVFAVFAVPVFKNTFYKVQLTVGLHRFLFLFLMFSVSLFACAENSREIGSPIAMKTSSVGCFGAVLSAGGKYFYTLRGELLSKYRISPFEIIQTKVADMKEVRERKDNMNCRVLISKDQSKLIIVFPYEILSLDINTGRMLQKVEINEKEGGIDGVALDGNSLILINGEDLILSIRDVDTFKIKKNIESLKEFKAYHNKKRKNFTAISIISNKIYIRTRESLLVLNKKTFKPELFVLCDFGCNNPRSTKDYQKIYLWNVLSIKDYVNDTDKVYSKKESQYKVMVFDQVTRTANFKESSNMRREIPAKHLLTTLVNREQASLGKNNKLISKRGNVSRAALLNSKTNVGYSFYQYDAGQAILQEWSPDRLTRTYFYLTPGARKYLMMKNVDGNLIPINDETFNKYYRKN